MDQLYLEFQRIEGVSEPGPVRVDLCDARCYWSWTGEDDCLFYRKTSRYIQSVRANDDRDKISRKAARGKNPLITT